MKRSRFGGCLVLGLGLLVSTRTLMADSPGDLFPDAAGEKRPLAPIPPPPQDPPVATAPAKPDETTAAPTVTPVVQPSSVKKIPIPSGSAQQDAAKLVNDAYKDDLATAVTGQQQTELAHKLLQAGVETNNDDAGRFILFTKSKEIALRACDMDSAFAAIDEIDKAYQIDALKMRAQAAIAISKVIQNTDQRAALAPKLGNLVDMSVMADRYDIARSIAEIGLSVARASDDPDLQRDAAAKVRQVREAEAAYVDNKAAIAVLAAQPADPDANLKVGQFRCFIKGDWDRGLPMLAMGSDATLKGLAAKELTGASDQESQVALGDGWWKIAEKATGNAKTQMQMRSFKWYNEALPNLTGLAKATAESRIKVIADNNEKAMPITIESCNYCTVFGDRVFDAQASVAANFPDELTLTSDTHSFRIAGKKKIDNVYILDQNCFHLGKVGVLNGTCAAAHGNISVEFPSNGAGQPWYWAMLMNKDGKIIKGAMLQLQVGQHYVWRLEPQGDLVKLRMFQTDHNARSPVLYADGKMVPEIFVARKDFGSIGFGATVRYPGDNAGMTVTYR